ncbi:hypothetical protein G7Y79_00060g092250 [Physcia stellaris]|nr:hypothetical protein G7Y79_00060g092250 [Physcia stellaris]
MANPNWPHHHSRSESAGLPSPVPNDSSQNTNPTSTILRDMLREKKAENRRLSRNLDLEMGQRGSSSNGPIDRDVQSSPISSSASGRGHERRSSAMGGRITSATKGMGVREMEEHVSKLNKQNFDLKLELFHRRQRDDALEAELERMKTLEADYAELQTINDDLVRELDLRDVAVKEAVALICELETKVEAAELQQQLTSHNLAVHGTHDSITTPPSRNVRRRPITPPPQQGLEDQLSPLRQYRGSDSQGHPPSDKLGRVPSFLREKKPSTSALRTVYQSDGNLSHVSLNRAGSPIRSQDADSHALNSPRLSMLSESSFVSVYGKSPKLSVQSRRDPSSDSASDRSFKDRLEHLSHDQQSSTPRSRDHATSRWLDQSMSGDETSPLQQRTRRQRPSKSGRKSPSSALDGNFSSISEVLHETPSHKLEKISPLPTLGGPIFGGPNVLPPTPDTMSTQKEANSSTQSIITEKSLGDMTRFPARNVSAMMPDDRPHTAGTLDTEYERHTDEHDSGRPSARPQKSETHTDAFIKESLQPSFPFMSGGSLSKAVHKTGHTPTRPTLTSYATNIMFDGDGIEEIQPSRGMSYPSPKESRRRSVAYTPVRVEHSRTASAQTQFVASDNIDSSPKAGITSSTKNSPFRSSPLKASSNHRSSIISPAPASQVKDSDNAPPAQETATESRIPRSSNRFGLGSIKNAFRRTSAYGAAAVLGAEEGMDGGESLSGIARPGTSAGGGGGGGRVAGEQEPRVALAG